MREVIWPGWAFEPSMVINAGVSVPGGALRARQIYDLENRQMALWLHVAEAEPTPVALESLRRAGSHAHGLAKYFPVHTAHGKRCRSHRHSGIFQLAGPFPPSKCGLILPAELRA
jgi:hypothetical protein